MIAYHFNVPEKPRPPKSPPFDPDPPRDSDAIDYRCRTLPVTSQPKVEETPDTTTSQEQEIPMTAAKKKVAKKEVKSAPASRPGVISTIIEVISRQHGASIEEVLAVLVKKFPDREPDAMKATCRIQCAKNATSKDRDEKRGLVYFKRR